jgi:hypothetical protein
MTYFWGKGEGILTREKQGLPWNSLLGIDKGSKYVYYIII